MGEYQNRDLILKEAFSYHQALKSYAYGLCPNGSLAEDAVQNSYMTITRKYTDFELGTSVLAWCRMIVRYEVLQLLRNNGREIATEDKLLFDAVSDAFDVVQTPDREVMRCERMARLRICFGKLTLRSKELVIGRYVENLDLGSIALKVKMTVGAVRKSLYRIRLELRACLVQEGNLR